ncbi:hypothetical protein PMI38_04598, partial [Pseudomonas sp. GM84]
QAGSHSVIVGAGLPAIARLGYQIQVLNQDSSNAMARQEKPRM